MGINAFHVDVEMEIIKGLPDFTIIGLGDAAVKESRERVRAAIRTSGLRFPEAKVTVNLAPADVKKTGSNCDLAIIAAMLSVTGEISADLSDSVFVGEASLGGDIRPVSGVLPMVILSKKQGYKNIFVPADNAFEASVVDGINVYGIRNVRILLDHFKGANLLKPQEKYNISEALISSVKDDDFADVKGHAIVKKALEYAAAGGHNLLMIGPPGTGKSMLAKRIPSILPPLSFEESIEITGLYSVSGMVDKAHPLITKRPFRSPHTTISQAALTGGGSIPRPGEISLAHRGVLFLDELPQFQHTALEALRQPLEDQQITVSRAAAKFTYPCTFMLVAAMNPCPCGYFGSKTHTCTCTDAKRKAYVTHVSGPLLDRFDIHIEVGEVSFDKLASGRKEEPSASIRERVMIAREFQDRRYKDMDIKSNAEIPDSLIDDVCQMSPEASAQFDFAYTSLGMSGRAFNRVLKLARTIADTEGEELIQKKHINRAVNFRALDRKYWNN
jgi:magnesium chelatase family protein